MRSLAGGVLLALVSAGAPASAAPESAKPDAKSPVVRYRDDKVSVDARDVGIDVLLRAIAKESGAELVGAPRTDRAITITFEDAPMGEALERLVGAQNFTLKYDDGGKLKAIELRGGQEAALKPKPAEDVPVGENTTPPKWVAFYKAVFDGAEPIPISGNLRTALGKEEVGYDYLANTAIGHENPTVRRAAMREMMKALDRDPDRREAVEQSLMAMTDAELASFARQTAHFRAEDFVRNALRETSDRELRSRARNVLRELRQNPYQGPRGPMR